MRSRSTPRSPTRSRWRRSARRPCGGKFGLLVREPVGVVGAIIPWNAPVALICHKIAPALLAGCTVVLKSSPEAPGEGYVFAEVARGDRPPAGRAQRRHRRPRGVGAARDRPGRRQDHVHRLDRGGPAHRRAVRRAHRPLHARARRQVGGRRARRHGPRDRGEDARPGRVRADRPGLLVADAGHREPGPPRRAGRRARRRASRRSVVGDPFDESTQLGPLVSERQRDRVEGYIAKGVDRGRDARHRWRPPARPRARLVRRADGVRQRRQPLDDRAARRSSGRC